MRVLERSVCNVVAIAVVAVVVVSVVQRSLMYLRAVECSVVLWNVIGVIYCTVDLVGFSCSFTVM